jgi:hypothetical protein
MDVPESKCAVDYLRKRGIQLATATDSGVEIMANGSHPPGIYRSRLGIDQWGNRRLSDVVHEGIWFPHKNARGEVESYSVRVFPELRGTDGEIVKFLTTKDKGGYPFVPGATWDAAKKPNHPLSITEGAVKCLALLQVDALPIGVGGVWMPTIKDDFGTDLHPVLAEGFLWRGRKVYLVFDADFATNLSVRQALIRTVVVLYKYGADVVIVRWPIEQGRGIDDYLVGKTGSSVPLPALFAEMRQAAVPLPETLRYLDLEIAEMELIYSRLKGASLAQFCRLIAKPLLVPASILQTEVEANRYRFIAEEKKDPLPNVIPRPLPVMLKEIREILKRYVTFLFPEEQSIIIALWIVHTWLFAAFDFTAYLYIYSPAWRSGKSRLLETISLLCQAPELTSGASAAALIRANDETNPPTFLIDELDTLYSRARKGAAEEAEGIRAFLNAGYERGSTFLKCVGQGADITVQRFPAFCPKALASIRQCLPGTVMDRSIPIEMERQKGRKAARLRKREVRGSVASLRDELKVLAADEALIDKLNKARPAMPDELNDRQQDVTEPLLAIADHAGSDWSEKSRGALVKLLAQQDEDQDISIRLLADIKRVFDRKAVEALSTESLLQGLIAIADDAPWPDMFEELLKSEKRRSAGSRLARYLKPYHIKPVTVRVGEEVSKGYHRDQFKTAWERYLPEISSGSPTSERYNVTNHFKALAENNLKCNVLPGSDPTCNVIRLQDKSLTEKEVTEKCNVVTSDLQDPGKEKLEEPQNSGNGTEIRLGYMSPEQMLKAIREVFPNAKIIPDRDETPPSSPPPGDLSKPQPELPL